MAEKQGKIVNVSNIVANPILTGRVDNLIWTGLISSKKVDQYLVPDEATREEFKKLIESFERDVIELREINSVKPNFTVSQNFDFVGRDLQIRTLKGSIRQKRSQIIAILNTPNSGIDVDLFWLLLTKEYEEVLNKNPNEFKNMDTDVLKELKRFYRTIVERPPLLREVYVPSTNEYKIITFINEAQERNLKKGNRNADKILYLVKSLIGKDSVSSQEGMEMLGEIFEAVMIIDFSEFIKDRSYADLVYSTLFKNYLLKIGFNTDEVQSMTLMELNETALETYNTKGAKYNKELVAKTIKDAIYFCDMDKLLLIAAARHLNSFAEMRTVQEVLEESKDAGLRRDISAGIESGEIKDITEEFVAEHDIRKDKIMHMHAFDDEKLIEKMKLVERIVSEILGKRLIAPLTTVTLDVYNSEQVEFSQKKLEEMMGNYCDGIYLTNIMQNNLIYKAFLIPGEMSNWSPELVQRLQFSDRDLIILSLADFRNLKILYENGKLPKDKIAIILTLILDGSINEILNEMKAIPERENDALKMIENTSNFLNYVVSEGIVTFEDLKTFYDMRIIKLKDLEELENNREQSDREEFVTELGNVINPNEVLITYKEYIEQKLRYEKALKENDPDVEIYKETMDIKRREKDSIVMLFSKYKLSRLSDKERKDFMDEFLLTYCLEFEYDDDAVVPETLRQMYKDGIVTFEEISSISNEYLQTVIIDLMFVRGELSLEDTRKLRSTLSLEALIAILNAAMVNSSISQTEKVSLIMNIFHNGIEDQEIADKFLSQLHAEHYQGIDYKELIKDKKKTKKKDDTTLMVDGGKALPPKDPSKEWVYPKFVKWEFLNALDKDAMITVYANGYVEAYSRKLGVRIIEKYFEVDKEGNQFGRDAYGHATFILDENTYIENLDMLVDSHSQGELLLNPKTLSVLVTEKRDRIRHNTHSINKNWMRSVAKRFEIDLETELDLVSDTRYTKEELAYLRDIITRYENEYIDRNAER